MQEEFKFDELSAVDALLLGRVTYEGFAAAWPHMKEQYSGPRPGALGEYADMMNGYPKYVVSTTLEEPLEWNNSSLIEGNVAEEVSRLKRQPGKDILIFGSGDLVNALTRFGRRRPDLPASRGIDGYGTRQRHCVEIIVDASIGQRPRRFSGGNMPRRITEQERQEFKGAEMTDREPVTELEPQFSSDDATPRAWAEARERLEAAEVYWLSTVRPDGRPHVTPLLCVWLEGALYFCTGPTERKARNLGQNPRCVLTAGCNALDEGLDLVVEGDAVRVTDDARLRRVADAYLSKYGSAWRFAVRDGAFYHDSGSLRSTDTSEALVFEVTPTKVLGFGKGEPFSQTRWRF